MLEFGDSRQAFPENGGKGKAGNHLGCLMVYCEIKVCSNGNAQNFFPLPRVSILQSITHSCSSLIVIQIISTRWTESENKEAEKESYKEIEPYFLGFLRIKICLLCISPFQAALPEGEEMCTMVGGMCALSPTWCWVFLQAEEKNWPAKPVRSKALRYFGTCRYFLMPTLFPNTVSFER